MNPVCKLLLGMKILLETHLCTRYRSFPEAGMCMSGLYGRWPPAGVRWGWEGKMGTGRKPAKGVPGGR